LNCHDTQKLLDAYVDGELDLTTTLAVEQHLQECLNCARAQTELQQLRTALAGGSLYFRPPPALLGRIQSAVRKASDAPRPQRAIPWRGLALAASLSFVALAGWEMFRFLTSKPTDDPLARELVALNVRSEMLPGHRFDVKSTDRHEVKPWFADKLDFSPPVCDLTDEGFDLLGGRLEYLNNRPVAALVYQRRKHHINLYVWPAPGSVSSSGVETRQGFHLVHWTQAGMAFWAISDMNESELQEFAKGIQEKTH
jgi:anti-sigma factor RsiW